MISLYYGKDMSAARKKAKEVIDSFLEKNPGAGVFRADSETFTSMQAEELARAESLFGESRIVLFDEVLLRKEHRDALFLLWETLLNSPVHFLFVEEELPDDVPEGGEHFEYKKKGEKEFYNPFGLADAFGARDKKRAWVLFRETLEKDIAPEETHGILFWQVKSLKLALVCKSAEEAGISPFVYGKAVRYTKNFTPLEIDQALLSLLKMYHQAHRGEGSLENHIEKFLLTAL